MDWKFAEETTAWVAESAAGEDHAWIITVEPDGQFSARMSTPPLDQMASGTSATLRSIQDRCEMEEGFILQAMDFMTRLEKANDPG